MSYGNQSDRAEGGSANGQSGASRGHGSLPLPQRRPPLPRERDHDVLATASAVPERELCAAYISEKAREYLRRHTWPGNIRELEDVVGAAAIDARDGRIPEKELKANLVVRGRGAVPAAPTPKTGGGASADATASAIATETATASVVGRAGAESPAAATKPWKREDEGEREREEQPQDSAQQLLGQGEIDPTRPGARAAIGAFRVARAERYQAGRGALLHQGARAGHRRRGPRALAPAQEPGTPGAQELGAAGEDRGTWGTERTTSCRVPGWG
jgi:hypothetical protein